MSINPFAALNLVRNTANKLKLHVSWQDVEFVPTFNRVTAYPAHSKLLAHISLLSPIKKHNLVVGIKSDNRRPS